VTTRNVAISLADLPVEVIVLAAVYTVAPLVIALAVIAAARRVAAAVRRLEPWTDTTPPSQIEPQFAPPAKKAAKQDAAYEAVRDWYAEAGSPSAQACYLIMSSVTGRHD